MVQSTCWNENDNTEINLEESGTLLWFCERQEISKENITGRVCNNMHKIAH